MQYMLAFFEGPENHAMRDDAATAEAYWGAWTAYSAAVAQAGVIVSGAGLEPVATATTVRVGDVANDVQDGPFADTKEQLGGFFVIDVADLDAALEWAARAPVGPGGGIEIRPTLPPPTL